MFGIDDAIVGAVGGSLVSGLLNNSAAAGRQADAQAFSAEQYATRYQTTVKDMQAAGLNPALAYGGISGSSPTSSAASSSGTPDLGSSFMNAKMNSAQIANIAADTENKKAQAALIEAQVSDTLASAQHKGTMVSNVEAATKKIHQEIENLKTDRDRIEATMFNLAEHTALMREQNKTETLRQSELLGIVEKLRLSNAISQADYDAMVKTGFIGRLAREMTPVSEIASEWLSPGKWLDKMLPSKHESTHRKVK